MYQRRMLFTWMLVILMLMPVISIANAIPFSADDMEISIVPGYTIYDGTWIANSQENAFLLLGSEDENMMKVAIANQSNNGQYKIIALSDKIISYEEYFVGSSVLLDKWDDGHPYFFYQSIPDKGVYIAVEESIDGEWQVYYGYITYYEDDLKYVFTLTENPNELLVYKVCYPQIYWPTQASMSLNNFDISEVENICDEALGYLSNFQSTHSFGEQDEDYKIVWTE